MTALLASMVLMAGSAAETGDFLVYPGAPLTRIGGERWNARDHAAVAYFVSGDAPALVARRLAQAARDDGRVVTVDGSENERVVSVMFTRERVLKSVILVPREGQTLGFSVLRRLDAPTAANDATPRLEGALPLADDGAPAKGEPGSRWWVMPRPMGDTRAQVAESLSKAGYLLSRAVTKKGGLQFSVTRGAERAEVELVSVSAASTVVVMRWAGAP